MLCLRLYLLASISMDVSALKAAKLTILKAPVLKDTLGSYAPLVKKATHVILATNATSVLSRMLISLF